MEQQHAFKSRIYTTHKNSRDTQERLEKFSLWLAKKDESLHLFLQNLPLELREQLDFSAKSLDALGKWLLEQFKNLQEVPPSESSSILDGAVRYIGEVFIRHIGGSGWDMQLWHPSFGGYGEPIIYGPAYSPFSVSPYSLITIIVAKRDATFLRKRLAGEIASIPPVYRDKRRGYLINTPAEWEEWLQDMQPALDHFFSLLPTPVASRLDYSVASLDVIGAWLSSQCTEGIWNDLELERVPEVTDGASRYLGETFIRHLDAEWDVNLTHPRKRYFRRPIVKGLPPYSFKYWPLNMLGFRVVGERKGKYLSQTLAKEVAKSQAGPPAKRDKVKLPPKSLIWYSNPNFGLDEAQKALLGRNLTVNRQGEVLRVQWREGLVLTVRLVRGQDVQAQIVKLTRRSPHASLAQHFDSQFEISFNSLDEVQNEANTMIEVQLTLQDATQGLIYNTWNKRVLKFEE